MSGDMIQCSNLKKNYGHKKVLKGVDLNIPPGTIYALLGTNGAGKTTLIRTLLGLIPRSSGNVNILGSDPWQAGPNLRQRIGYVSEEQGLYGWMKIAQIIKFCRDLYPKWNSGFVASSLQRFGLAENTRIRTLSKGQKVRLALILALAPEPDLLILDEPMSGLDPLAQRDFLKILQQDAERTGRTIFFSTHDLHDVETIATHVAILFNGRIQATGALDAVRASIRRIRTTGQLKNLPPQVRELEVNKDGGVYLLPAADQAWPEITGANGDCQVLEDSPALLEEVCLYYCAGGDKA